MRIGLRYVVAAVSIIALDACASRIPGRQPGSDIAGPGTEGTFGRSVREAFSTCSKDPKGGTASPSELERCRVAEADAARRRPAGDTAVTPPRRTP